MRPAAPSVPTRRARAARGWVDAMTPTLAREAPSPPSGTSHPNPAGATSEKENTSSASPGPTAVSPCAPTMDRDGSPHPSRRWSR